MSKMELHYNELPCLCSIFSNKRISLQLLAIHRILIHVEESFQHTTEDFSNQIAVYETSIFQRFKFFVNISLFHMSQLKAKFFVMNTCLSDLIDLLKCEHNLDKIIAMSIEMISESHYERLKTDYQRKDNSRYFNFSIFS